MAQATFSCPFGAIHLENRRGTAQNEHFVLIVAHPTPSGPSGHLPLTGESAPDPITGDAYLQVQAKFPARKI